MSPAPKPAPGDADLADTLTPEEVARLTGYTVGTLATRRSQGLPPKAMAGCPVRYRLKAVLAFIETREVENAAGGRARVKSERDSHSRERDRSGMEAGTRKSGARKSR